MAKQNCGGYLDKIQENTDRDVMLEMLRLMMQTVMEEGVARHVGAERHERTAQRRGHRNGYKPRSVKTRMGELDLSVPQARGVEPYEPYPLAKWQRSERALLVACAEMYFMGVSTRKVSRVLEEMGGFSLSQSTVSRVAAELDERLTEFRDRRLDHCSWPFLMVDACYIKVRRNGSVKNQAVLVVAGIADSGRREILTWRVDDVESESTWSEVFTELRQRGVKGVKCVVSDGHEGIHAAAARQFPSAAWQRCWFHFIRNALNKVSHKDKTALARDLNAARKLEDVKLCLAEAVRVAQRWERRYPKVARQILDQFEQTLTVHHLPPRLRRRLYTSNLLERVMEEIRRRTRVVGIFPNVASCDRLVGAQLLERQEDWLCERMRYVVFEEGEQLELSKSAKRKVA